MQTYKQYIYLKVTAVIFRDIMQKYVNVIRYFPLQNMQELLYIGLLSSNTIFKKRFGFKYVT